MSWNRIVRPSGEKRARVAWSSGAVRSRASEPSGLTKLTMDSLLPPDSVKNHLPSGDQSVSAYRSGSVSSDFFFVLTSMIQLERLQLGSSKENASLPPSGDQAHA